MQAFELIMPGRLILSTFRKRRGLKIVMHADPIDYVSTCLTFKKYSQPAVELSPP